jgi:hypothetical protein
MWNNKLKNLNLFSSSSKAGFGEQTVVDSCQARQRTNTALNRCDLDSVILNLFSSSSKSWVWRADVVDSCQARQRTNTALNRCDLDSVKVGRISLADLRPAQRRVHVKWSES